MPGLEEERPRGRTRVRVIHYGEGLFEEREDAAALPEGPPAEGVVWIDVRGLGDGDVLERTGAAFGLHPLVLEDVLNTTQRPKLEDYGEKYLFIVVKALGLEEDGSVATEQVCLVLGEKNFVISFQEDGASGKGGDLFAQVRERLRSDTSRLRRQGADHLAHALLDRVVDDYFAVLEELGERVEALEDMLLARPERGTLKELHRLRREMLTLRRSVWPLREVLAALSRPDSSLVSQSAVVFMRDVYDHTVRAIESIETYREMLASMLDIYLSSISNRMNEVMKVLTIIATIFMPLSFLAGVYGMNFEFMPELKWPWGYPAALLLMAAVAGGMLVYFRRKKWL